MNVAILIINYRTCDLLRNCIQSIENSRSHTDASISIIVVDNNSNDGSEAMIHTEFPDVHYIASTKNLGFTRGNNLGLELLGFDVDHERPMDLAVLATIKTQHADLLNQPRPDLVFCLNPDTELVDDALQQLIDFMQDNPDVGMCGAHLSYGSGDFQHGAFHFPTLSQIALDFFPLTGIHGIRRFAPRLHNSPLNGRYAQSLWLGDQPFPVDFVLGATMMIRGDAIAKIGGLDEGFFMYCEEMDWCLRLKRSGWGVYALPTAHVTHYEGQSTRQVRWLAYQHLWNSRFRFYRKHADVYPNYLLGYINWVRWLVRLGMTSRSHDAWRRFAQGQLTGTQVNEELSTYQRIAQL